MSEVKRVAHKCRVVPESELPPGALVIPGELILDDGTYDYLCGHCEIRIVRGYSLIKPSPYLTKKDGSFVTCQKCSAYNEVAAPRIS